MLREVGCVDDDDGGDDNVENGEDADRFSPSGAIALRQRSSTNTAASGGAGGAGHRPSAAGRMAPKTSFSGAGMVSGGVNNMLPAASRVSSVFFWDARATSPEQLVFGVGVQVTSVALGSAHVLATSAEGFVFAWGDNTHGQLGLGDTDARDSPVLNPLLTGKRIRKVACGADFSACVSDNGLLQVLFFLKKKFFIYNFF